jgi:hypothetical protein
MLTAAVLYIIGAACIGTYLLVGIMRSILDGSFLLLNI